MKAATQGMTPTETPIAIATLFPWTPARLVTVEMALPIINLGCPVLLSRIVKSLSMYFNHVKRTIYLSLLCITLPLDHLNVKDLFAKFSFKQQVQSGSQNCKFTLIVFSFWKSLRH